MLMSELGDYIQARRKSLGLKQSDVADRVKKSTATISEWENGAHVPPFEQIDLLATALEEKTPLKLYKKAGYLDNLPNVDIIQILEDLSGDEVRVVRNMLKAFVEAQKHS